MYDLPSVYKAGYYQAKLQSNKKYKLYYRGTLNEVFPGQLFDTPSQAKNYCHAMIIKQNEKKG